MPDQAKLLADEINEIAEQLWLEGGLDERVKKLASIRDRVRSLYVPSDADAKDAARYRYWREAHAQGMRPFLPEIGQGRLTSRTIWTHLVYGDLHNDDWMKSTPAERCTLIDKALDERMPSTCERSEG